MNARDLGEELASAVVALGDGDREVLVGHGVARDDIAVGMVGVAPIRLEGDLYEPDPDYGKSAFVTPVRVHYPEGPESNCPESAVRVGDLVDLIAWHPARPDRWALRVGSAEWLGCIGPQYLDPEPVPVHRSVLSWLRAGCVGLMPLSRDRRDIYRLLTWCTGGIVAEDADHAAELRRALSHPWPAPRVFVPEGRRVAA